MAPDSRQGPIRSDELARSTQIAAPVNELDHFAHLHRMDWF
jgi:hypothetical protein